MLRQFFFPPANSNQSERRNQRMEQKQAELRALINEFRSIEHNRKEYNDETQAQQQKQRLKLQTLQTENELLKNELLSMARVKTKHNFTITEQNILKQIHDTGEKYSNLIEIEHSNINTLQNEIEHNRKLLLSKSKNIGGINAYNNNNIIINKQINILENRLEKSIIKLNEIIATNKSLKTDIDHNKKESLILTTINNKLNKEYNEIKDKMSSLVEQSNNAYELRDSYLLEITAIECEYRKEKEKYESEISELNNLLDNEYKLPSLSFTTSNTNTTNNTLTSVASTTLLTLTNGGTGSVTGTGTMPEKTDRQSSSAPTIGLYNDKLNTTLPGQRKKITRKNKLNKTTTTTSRFTSPLTPATNNYTNTANHNTTTNKTLLLLDNQVTPTSTTLTPTPLNPSLPLYNNTNTDLEHIQNFENAFNYIRQNIHDIYNINTIQELINIFTNNEKNNYSLFEYITQQNNEIELINNKINILKEEEQQYNTQQVYTQQQQNILDSIISDIKQQESIINKYNNKNNKYITIIEQCNNSINSILNTLVTNFDTTATTPASTASVVSSPAPVPASHHPMLHPQPHLDSERTHIPSNSAVEEGGGGYVTVAMVKPTTEDESEVNTALLQPHTSPPVVATGGGRAETPTEAATSHQLQLIETCLNPLIPKLVAACEELNLGHSHTHSSTRTHSPPQSGAQRRGSSAGSTHRKHSVKTLKFSNATPMVESEIGRRISITTVSTLPDSTEVYIRVYI